MHKRTHVCTCTHMHKLEKTTFLTFRIYLLVGNFK